MTDLRCQKCHTKLAEALDGKLIIRCRCGLMNVLIVEVKVTQVEITRVNALTLG